jgi:outer membrane protein
MKSCRLLLLLLGAAPALFGQPALTLAEALAEARAHSPTARAAAARLAAAEAEARAAATARQPTVILTAGYAQTNDPMQGFGMILRQGTFDNTIDFNHPGRLDQATVGLRVTQPLYTGGRLTAGSAAGRAAATASRHAGESALAALDLAVAETVLGWHHATAQAEALAAAHTALAASLTQARVREAEGDLLAAERLNLEVELSTLASYQLALAHETQVNRRRLASLLGREDASGLTLVRPDASLDALDAPPVTAATARPELAAKRAEVTALEHQVVAARGALRPSVAAFASVEHSRGWERSGSGEGWLAGVAAEWTVFDGQRHRSALAAAQARLETARAELAQLELDLDLQAAQGHLALTLAQQQITTSTARVAAARASAAQSRARFAAGALLSTELLGVESRLTAAEIAHAQSTLGERLAVARLRHAAGLPLLSHD